VYGDVLAELRAQYTLGYLSANERTDGRWRAVELRLTRADLKGARVRSRPGYFARFLEPAP